MAEYSARLNITHPNVVQLIYYKLKSKNCDFCDQSSKSIDVFIEGPLGRNLPPLQSSCQCKQIIKGFKYLKKKYGPFQIDLQNLWTKEGKVKIWLTSNPFSNKKVAVKENEMTENLLRILKEINCHEEHSFNRINVWDEGKRKIVEKRSSLQI